MIKREGFTLLELMIVIVIIGVLAALAMPRYIDVTEKAKGAEGIVNCGILRNAELRYFAEYDTYTSTLGNLDVEDPSVLAKFFSFTVTGGSSDTSLVVTAKRSGGKYSGRTLTLDYDGNWGGTWPWKPR